MPEPKTDSAFDAAAAVEAPSELLEGGLPGLCGDIVEHVLASARRPNRGMSAAAGFAVLGKIADRRIAGPTKSSTTMYYNVVARTAVGKDIIQEAIEVFLTEIGMGDVLGPAEPASVQAIQERLKLGPSWVYILDEWGSFLDKMTGPGQSANTAALTYLLRILYSRSAWKRYGGLDRAHELAQSVLAPAVTFVGLSTDEAFYKALQPDWIHDGTLNRMFNLDASPKSAAARPERTIDEVPPSLARDLRDLRNWGGDPYPDVTGNGIKPRLMLGWLPGAEECYMALEEEQDEAGDSLTESLQARLAENAVRLATKLTVGLRDTRISRPVMELSAALSRRSVALLKEGIDRWGNTSPLDHGPMCALIANTFKEAAKFVREPTMDRGEFYRRFGRRARFGTRSLQAAVEQLQLEGALRVGPEGKKGGIVYRWIGGR